MSSPFFQPPARAPFPGVPVAASAVSERLEVFVSHATVDKQHVGLVKQQMEALGISVYLAEHDPQPGTILAQKVRDAIHRCHAVLVLITTASINSAYVQQELGIANECGKPIVPIVEKGVDTGGLGILQGVEYLELDLDHPSETMAKMTAKLQPMVLAQLHMNLSVVSVTQSSGPDAATALMLVCLGLILGVLIVAALSSGDGGS